MSTLLASPLELGSDVVDGLHRAGDVPHERRYERLLSTPVYEA